jgi:glycosyltransferase involved in cell wall biosynthesis
VNALRAHARVYVHGHTVGGTNPSLVEALGAGAATVAHDNPFNRWVAGDAAVYFSEAEGCGRALRAVVDDATLRRQLREHARRRHAEAFTWDAVLSAYEHLL